MDARDIFKKLSKGISFKRNSLKNVHTCKTQGPNQIVNIENKKHEFTDSDSSDSNMTNISPGGNKLKVESEEVISKKFNSEEVAHLRKVLKIKVKGKNIPDPVESFETLLEKSKVGKQILRNLSTLGYSTPTPIQMQAIPIMILGKQVMACAPTGSGKTVAFLVPIIINLGKRHNSGFRALILCPTRELTKQTHRECERLIEGTGLRVHTLGKVSMSSQKFGPNFSKQFDILISTPNRLIFLLKKEGSPLNLENLEWLIIDESDKLFEAGEKGFRNQLAEIYRACGSSQLKRAMFSATHMDHLRRWCRKNLQDLVELTVGIRNTAVQNVQQELIYVGKEYGKLIALRDLIQQGFPTPAIIFVQSKDRTKELFEELIHDGVYVDMIHSDRTQLQRDNVVRAFREGKVWVLICTELMGRGIDFKGVKLVINYDFPQSAISYIHRIGRTGRAGKPGKAITFFTDEDKLKLRSIAKIIKESGCPVPDYTLTLKQAKRSEKCKHETQVPKREHISTSIQ